VTVKSVQVGDDGMSATLEVDRLVQGFVYEFDLEKLRSQDQESLLHRDAYYTVNEIPSPSEQALK
jgi:hypothetical protein